MCIYIYIHTLAQVVCVCDSAGDRRGSETISTCTYLEYIMGVPGQRCHCEADSVIYALITHAPGVVMGPASTLFTPRPGWCVRVCACVPACVCVCVWSLLHVRMGERKQRNKTQNETILCSRSIPRPQPAWSQGWTWVGNSDR